MRTLSSNAASRLMAMAGVMLLAAAQSYAQVVYHLEGIQFFDMTDDGRTAIGYLDVSGQRAALTWSAEGGINRWGLDPTIPGTSNGGGVISGDGSTYFGGVIDGSNNGWFRYRGPGTYQFIPNPAPSYRQYFLHSSRNGDAAVGYAYNYTIPFASHVAVRWTAQTGTVALGFGADSDATDISADGNTIVGHGYDTSGTAVALAWTAASGSRRLADLPGSGVFGSQAYAVTGDGRVIAGVSGEFGQAVIWRDGIIESLGTFAGASSQIARSISDDASIITGSAWLDGSDKGFVWTRDHGMELIEQFFIRNGVTTLPTDIAQSRRWRVAPSGTTLYLEGYGGYIVTIPTPATLALLGTLIPLSARRRRPTMRGVSVLAASAPAEACMMPTGHPAHAHPDGKEHE